MNIRRARDEDAAGIHDAHMKSIREVCSKDHSTEEISGWGHRPFNHERWLNAIRTQDVWVVDDGNGKIEGYGHLKIYQHENLFVGYIHGLYLTPQALGQKNGYKIFQEILQEAIAKNVAYLQLEATLTAHEFYKKLGFHDAAPMMTVEIGGSPVRCFPMRMDLEKRKAAIDGQK